MFIILLMLGIFTTIVKSYPIDSFANHLKQIHKLMVLRKQIEIDIKERVIKHAFHSAILKDIENMKKNKISSNNSSEIHKELLTLLSSFFELITLEKISNEEIYEQIKDIIPENLKKKQNEVKAEELEIFYNKLIDLLIRKFF